uniref:Uncharacterized protein n=1 Tax=Quercus lobata TaxID=97700 RepID=A0A7N2MMU2_QUELO
MAVPNTQTEPPASAQTPLIILDSHQQEELNDTQLNHSLHRLETFLRIFGFCQYSALSITLSWLVFLLLGVALPLSIIELSYCSNCEKYQIKNFELEILVSESLLAAISLLFISHNLRKYGERKFLFVDRCHGHMTQFREEYLQKINGFFRLLAVWLLPCFLLKTVRDVICMVSSIVELVGLIIFLHSVAKISYRSLSLAAISSRWHALVTCNPNDVSQRGISSNGGNLEAAIPAGSLPINYSESDLESIDYFPVPTNTQMASYISMYHKRQAFVMYMQSNLGGATIYGWTIDRPLINTVFFLEFSLVLFVLGKTMTFTTK